MATLLPPPPPAGGPASDAASASMASAEPAAPSPVARSGPPPLPDPGNWNLLHSEKESVLSIGKSFWEGARLVYNRGLNQNFQVAHTFTLTPEGNKANNYTFAPVYIASSGESRQTTIVQGEIAADGSEMAQVIFSPTEAVQVVAVGQSKGKQWVYSQGSVQYSGKGWTGSFMCVKQPLQAVTIYVSDYLRKWGERLTVGAQFMAQSAEKPQPGQPGLAPMLSVAARWREKDWVATGTAGLMDGSMHASYYHYMPPVQGSGMSLLGCDFIWNPQLTGQVYPIAKIGVQQYFGNTSFKAHLTSGGEVAASLDQEIFPPLTFNLNGVLDHHSGVFKCGVGLTFNS